jgi:hypothetical protein
MQWIIMLLMGSGLTSLKCAAEAELSSGVLDEFSLRIMYEDCGYGHGYAIFGDGRESFSITCSK